MRTISWHADHIVIIDQTKLPGTEVLLPLRTVDELIDAITSLAVRGAPALGASGAYGVALASSIARRDGLGHAWVHEQATRIAAARPTAVNLSWGVAQVRPLIEQGPGALLAAAEALADADVADNMAIGERGADWLLAQRAGPLAIQTHCNTGALATVDWGTALGIVRTLHGRGMVSHVYADETRPLLQGSRLTAYELVGMGVPHHVVADGAGATVIARGMVHAVIVGADRIAANGDTANKVGTYPLALAAKRAGIPFVVAAPESTIDMSTPDGAHIEIEMRDGREVVEFAGIRVAPASTEGMNFAFDVTPNDLISAIVTQGRVIVPDGTSIGLR